MLSLIQRPARLLLYTLPLLFLGMFYFYPLLRILQLSVANGWAMECAG